MMSICLVDLGLINHFDEMVCKQSKPDLYCRFSVVSFVGKYSPLSKNVSDYVKT